MKPDWKDAPGWANYVAMDSDGCWHWYEHEPVPDESLGEWWFNGHDEDELLEGILFDGWRDTLEKRPK